MKVTYINHSCFLVETEKYQLLFDYATGELPVLDLEKPLYSFTSHFHHDHFNKRLFDLIKPHPDVHYIMANSNYPTDMPDRLYKYTTLVEPNSEYNIGDLKLTTLKSTDEGVSYTVYTDCGLIYHAGDLNAWLWEGETESYNQKMKKDYIKEISKLKDMEFLLAFLPLDPRQSPEHRELGIKIFLQYTKTKNIFPMHMWDKYDIAPELAAKLGEQGKLFCNATFNGQTFEIKEEPK